MYRIVTQPHSRAPEGHVLRKWSRGAKQFHAAIALQHRELVETVSNTDGISKEQAELQVTAFEKQFTDHPR